MPPRSIRNLALQAQFMRLAKKLVLAEELDQAAAEIAGYRAVIKAAAAALKADPSSHLSVADGLLASLKD